MVKKHVPKDPKKAKFTDLAHGLGRGQCSSHNGKTGHLKALEHRHARRVVAAELSKLSDSACLAELDCECGACSFDGFLPDHFPGWGVTCGAVHPLHASYGVLCALADKTGSFEKFYAALKKLLPGKWFVHHQLAWHIEKVIETHVGCVCLQRQWSNTWRNVVRCSCGAWESLAQKGK